MATARPQLHLVEPAEVAVIAVPAGLLEDALTNAAAIADDLQAGLDAAERFAWSGSRAGVLNEIGRMSTRIDTFRDAFAALDPKPTNPRRPTRVA